jgi:hypothetical protein
MFTSKARIKVNYGNIEAKILGKTNENLYSGSIFDSPYGKDGTYYDNPTINKDFITKNETMYLSSGDEYTFSIVPTEVVTIQITSKDGSDAEIIGENKGIEKIYHLNGKNEMGILIAFQN